MTFPSNGAVAVELAGGITLPVGTRVSVKGAYLDEALTRPVLGTVRDAFPRPDWGGLTAYAVMFEHDEPFFPPGGEFTAEMLEVLGARGV